MIAAVVVTGCVHSQTQTKTPSSIGETGQEEVMEKNDGDVIKEEDEQMMEKEEVSQVKEFSITARRWEFDPSTITVNIGDTVKLSITSIDVTHGFNIPDFNIDEQLRPNTTVNIEFVADRTGSFPFRCSVICGSGHLGMTGKLIVN